MGRIGAYIQENRWLIIAIVASTLCDAIVSLRLSYSLWPVPIAIVIGSGVIYYVHADAHSVAKVFKSLMIGTACFALSLGFLLVSVLTSPESGGWLCVVADASKFDVAFGIGVLLLTVGGPCVGIALLFALLAWVFDRD